MKKLPNTCYSNIADTEDYANISVETRITGK